MSRLLLWLSPPWRGSAPGAVTGLQIRLFPFAPAEADLLQVLFLLLLRAASVGCPRGHREDPVGRPRELFSSDLLPLIHGLKRVCTRME